MPLTPATLADDITAMLAAYKLYDEEFQDWLNGAAGGGVALDGKFPLTSRLTSVTRQTKSPAQLEADVTGVVDSANTYATAAQNAQTAAETAETNAQTAETNALAHKDNAVTAQSAAEAAQSAAENAAVNALAQANNAATSYDQFDDRYLGVFTTALEPTVDNDGDALLAGAIYWNSDLTKFKVYTGSAWSLAFDLTDAPSDGSLYGRNNGAWSSALPAAQLTGTIADARIGASSVTQHQAALALATSQITSGTFADARIAASNVTQHQAALAITESQISDLRFKDQGTGNGVDFDTIHATEGFWGYTTTATNEPFDYGILLNLSDGAQAVQMAFGGSSDGKLAIRRRDSGVFYGWTHAAMLSNSGKLPDVDVAQSNVTQHQAALTITEGQITGAAFTNWNTAYGWGDHGAQGYALAANVLPLAGGTMTGRLIAGLTDDVNLLGVSGSLIIGGDGTSAHIAIDNNEIMAKATATTSSTLNLQVEGGTVACGGPLTATAFTEGGTALSSKYLGISAQAADSALLGGVAESTAAAVNTIVKRTASGYVYGVYFNSSQGAETSTASHYIYQNGSDGFYRKKTLANAQTEIVTAAAINAVGTTTNTVSTVAKRDSSGDLTCRLVRPQYNASATVFNYVNVQNARGTGDNYIRAASLANFRARCMAGYLGDQPYTVSTASPSGGGDGDFWFKREA